MLKMIKYYSSIQGITVDYHPAKSNTIKKSLKQREKHGFPHLSPAKVFSINKV